MTQLILKKKIHPAIMVAVLYLSFCLNYWMVLRGFFAHIFVSSGSMIFLAHEFFLFFLIGIFPTFFYEVITRFTASLSKSRLGESVNDMRYALYLFFIAANILIFGLRFFYLLSPFLFVYGNIFLDFVVTLGFFIGFLFFSLKTLIISFTIFSSVVCQ